MKKLWIPLIVCPLLLLPEILDTDGHIFTKSLIDLQLTSSKPKTSLMINIIGASSLKRALQNLDFDNRNTLGNFITAIPSLSLNPYVQSDTLKLSFLLDHGILKNTNQLVIWHDILNNSLTPHKSNNNTALTPKELATELLKYKSRITALVYCERIGAPHAFDDLRDQDFIVIRVTENLLSRRKQNDIPLLNEYSRLHPVADIESKSLFIVLEHRNNLKALSQNTRSPSKKPSQRKRRLKKLLEQSLKST